MPVWVWVLVVVALVAAIAYRVGAYLAIRRSGHDVEWSIPLVRMFRRARRDPDGD